MQIWPEMHSSLLPTLVQVSPLRTLHRPWKQRFVKQSLLAQHPVFTRCFVPQPAFSQLGAGYRAQISLPSEVQLVETHFPFMHVRSVVLLAQVWSFPSHSGASHVPLLQV